MPGSVAERVQSVTMLRSLDESSRTVCSSNGMLNNAGLKRVEWAAKLQCKR